LSLNSTYSPLPTTHLHSFPTRRSSDLPRYYSSGPRPKSPMMGTICERRRGCTLPPVHLPVLRLLQRIARTIRIGIRTRRHSADGDRKSTRLNSSHLGISYAVFCLKKKK